ncbi:patatin-like phospholipase domain-containing protein 1-like [Patagioenas fasciata monilis]|uniref:Patatin-like phospholipase domain-containing protein 1-like n=1 Tax=Patagioenas fasciata monilis TaxID=372326 RepID=A0A1V4KXD0_PATFA|nr:patatin-like phospholipase domain-containing protein 1-like [Patagioenas fasciata monilis]
MEENGKEGGPFSILFRGCSFLIVYEAGVVAALRELAPDILKSASRIYGASSGAVVATLVLCECDIEEIKLSFLSAMQTSLRRCFPGGKILEVLQELLERRLPPRAHELVSGRLHVVLTRVRDWRSVVVSRFSSRDDLIQAVMCSCFIPLYFGFLPPVFQGVRYADGELSMWQNDFVSRTTITISAFAGEYNICPKESPAPFFTFQFFNYILQISKRNISLLQYIFQLPTCQVLEQFYTHGYQDAVSFLKRLSEFGINYLDEGFMPSLANDSCRKGEGTLHGKPEAGILRCRAPSAEDVTKENAGTMQAADEVEEEAPRCLLHQWKAASSEGSKRAPTATGRRSRHPSVCEAQE